ncbi:MAG: hypothetical protein ABSF18_07265, partial [Gammaproteobacteria bacterium]
DEKIETDFEDFVMGPNGWQLKYKSQASVPVAMQQAAPYQQQQPIILAKIAAKFDREEDDLSSHGTRAMTASSVSHHSARQEQPAPVEESRVMKPEPDQKSFDDTGSVGSRGFTASSTASKKSSYSWMHSQGENQENEQKRSAKPAGASVEVSGTKRIPLSPNRGRK